MDDGASDGPPARHVRADAGAPVYQFPMSHGRQPALSFWVTTSCHNLCPSPQLPSRFREQGASDLLESMWGQCRAPLLQQLVAAAETGAAEAAAAGGSGEGPGGGGLAPGGWRGCEAALLCVRAIHMPIKVGGCEGQGAAMPDLPMAYVQWFPFRA